jgi:hypothetical protein
MAGAASPLTAPVLFDSSRLSKQRELTFQILPVALPIAVVPLPFP